MIGSYRADNYRSMERAFAQPKGLRELLAWFLHEWALEVPDTVHVPGVWRDYVRWDEDRTSVGGSALGAPPLADPFRRYTENSPSEVDADGFYMRPVHKAIATLGGRRDGTKERWMARFLFRLGLAHGDLDTVGAESGLHPHAVSVYAESALYRLWQVWRPAN